MRKNPTAQTVKTPPQKNQDSICPPIAGLDKEVPTYSGQRVRYVNLDNSATTPPFAGVVEKVNSFLELYASVHRGSGYKSLLSTRILEDARTKIGEFVEADSAHDVVIFGINTTHCINKLARKLSLQKTDVILVSDIEHSSNELPWRKLAHVIHVQSEGDGKLSLSSLRKALEQNAGRVKLVALTGASNITGYIPPIHDAARVAHEFGVRVFIDCAQLAPHRRVDILPQDDPRHLDFIAFSGHKMYAPFGLGVLVGSRKDFEDGTPDDVGGGTVDMITENDQLWTSLPNREHAGTPNAIGAVALATSAQILLKMGFDCIAEHERNLTSYVLKKIKSIPQVRLYCDQDESVSTDRLGVIPFNVDGMEHGLVAAILGFEYGIGVRHGHLCQYEFMRRTLGITPEQNLRIVYDIRNSKKSTMYGMVRASLALYNTEEDIDCFIEALARIVLEGPNAKYEQNQKTGEFTPVGWSPKWEFSLDI